MIYFMKNLFFYEKLLFGANVLDGIIKEGGEMASEAETKLKNEQEDFENVFKILQNQLLAASVHLYIFEQLFPTEKVVGTINQYKGFFMPTIDAHVDRVVNKVSDILSNGPNAPSFYRILNMIGRNSNLAPDIDVREVKKLLREHKETMEAICKSFQGW
jgi:hypothetical protein